MDLQDTPSAAPGGTGATRSAGHIVSGSPVLGAFLSMNMSAAATPSTMLRMVPILRFAGEYTRRIRRETPA